MVIPITTGNISREYKIIDSIFALDSHKESFFSGAADPGKAFDGVKVEKDREAEFDHWSDEDVTFPVVTMGDELIIRYRGTDVLKGIS